MKQIVFLIIIFLLLIIIGNLIFSITSLWSKKDLLTQTREHLVKEQQEHLHLQAQWQQVNSPSFVEQQARDKLFLAKPGESLVLVPTASPAGSLKVIQGNLPVWRQWLSLFF
jgi:cell division protein FtsB